MLRRALVLFAALGVSTTAWAAQQPESQYLLPVESGALDSHVHLQLMYSHASTEGILGHSADWDVAVLGIEGQYAFADRLEVGLNVPFVSYRAASWGTLSDSDVQLGNIILGLKGKLFGSSSGPIAVSLFLNTLLPTASGIDNREFAILHGGAAASVSVLMLTFGGDVGVYHLINGKGTDGSIFLVDLFGAVKILPFLGAQLAMQMGTPFYPDEANGDPGVAFCPAVQLFPLPFLHFGIGARIAANDNGRLLYNAGGRASLVFSGGLNF